MDDAISCGYVVSLLLLVFKVSRIADMPVKLSKSGA
jgi:hypothetical protein